jgi:glycosyltransferase involved in cell wall biosynthesis
MSLAPVALFAYRRPLHLQRVVESLLHNDEAAETDLVVFSDAARKKEDEQAVLRVREYLQGVSGFRSVRIVRRAENFGLSRSIISGVTELVEKHDRVVVLEDDIVVSSHFLSFMNRNLSEYAQDEKVGAITGYCFPMAVERPDTWFLEASSCWGWGTWGRAWKEFNPNGKELLKELKIRDLLYRFDFDGNYPYTGMLKDQIRKKNDSWAIRWYASTYLNGFLTLFPGKTLVANIGWDGSGENCGIEAVDFPAFNPEPLNSIRNEAHIDEKLRSAVYRSVIPEKVSAQKLPFYRLKIALKRWF